MEIDETTKPVIFLATADDKDRPLRQLPAELRAIRQALAHAETAGLCELVERTSLTADDLRDVFLAPKYRHRIAVFHFAGHAGDYHLLLEHANGEAAMADAGGLADFLAQQRGLQLVLLNACSTQAQVEGLFDSVPVVIATSQAVRDDVARTFAEVFYQSLGTGAELRSAFEEAGAGVRLSTSGDYRELLVENHEATGQPWQLFVKPGAETAAQWNLPDAADNPLFGLPALPMLDLPPKPFRHLQWFSQDDAEVFFGRDYETHDLYRKVTDPSAAPLTLLYGGAGVGKSSLLAAGLTPRLADFEVRYVRRDADLGLIDSLQSNFALPDLTLDEVWRSLERQSGRPLVVILDQLEETFTRPNLALPGELVGFLEALCTLFANRDARPQGKLLLSFRKEWLAEMETRLRAVKLPYSKVFLEPLNRRGVIQAVTGPTRSERLRLHYGLSVAAELPELMADDLLEDTGSPVAPTLQVLLSKLWDAAQEQSQSRPEFTQRLYQTLKRDGILLADFLEQQLAALHTWRPELVTSGLALDLLALHTTPLGTAARRSAEELRALYPHQDDLPELVQTCRDLYLLTETSGDGAGALQTTRLAHDTLAPLVRQRYEASVHPGQQARRILESRARDWQGGAVGTPLDARDLLTVECGATGMRTWQPAERELIAVSRKAAANRQVFWLVFGGAVGAGLGLGVLRALIAAFSDFRFTWSSQFGIYAAWGSVLGASLCLGFLFPQLLRQHRHFSTGLVRSSSLLFRGGWLAILSGTFSFGMGSLLLGIMVRGSPFALLEDHPLILPTGLLAGLGVSLALAGYLRFRGNVPWLLGSSLAALTFVLAQWLLVVAGGGGSAGQVVLDDTYFRNSYSSVYTWFESLAPVGTVDPNDLATSRENAENSPADKAASWTQRWLPQTWYAQLSLLDAALVGLVLTLGTAAGLNVAGEQLGLWEEEKL